MKNAIKFTLSVLFLLFTVQFISAHSYREQYDTNDRVIFIKYSNNQYDEYQENEYRYPTYDYKNGYTYRITDDYRETKQVKDRYYNYDNQPSYSYKLVRFQDTPSYYYEYSDYMREYQKHECYNYPPSNKLIYVKCP